tara:strand:+ start:598 stop:906 length:309 start_codon:yes stop_codon:yes gene_type:complete
MDTIAIAIIGPIIGVMFSMKNLNTVAKKQNEKLNQIEEMTLNHTQTTLDLVKKQQSFLTLAERVTFLENTIDKMDERNAKKMIALLQPITKSIKDVRTTIGV